MQKNNKTTKQINEGESLNVQNDVLPLQFFWNKKIIVSYFLSVLVFFIHISTFVNYDNTETDIISIINRIFEYTITQLLTPIAVPLFFIISGFAFFRDYNHTKYINKLKSRVKTLLIPYLSWNIIWTCFEIALSFSPFTVFFARREKFELSIQNVFLSVFHCKVTPFWFIFDLMIFCIISPLIYMFIKKKYLGIAFGTIILVLMYFDIVLPTEIFFREDSIFFFVLGAFLGVHYKSFFSERSKTLIRFFSLAILALCCFVNWLDFKNMICLPMYAQTVFLSLFSLSFWFAFDIIINNISPKPFMKRSFMVFVMHINVSAIITKLLFLALPKTNLVVIPNAIITVFLTLLFINYFCIVLHKICPRLYSLLTGARI